MRLIDADALLNELDRLDLDYGAMGGVAECIAITEHAPTIVPIEDTKSCGVSADRQTDQNVENVPSGDLISRQAVLELFPINVYYDRIAEQVKELPSAETTPVVAYICDRRRCAICRGKDGGCDHTTDIKHAAHFKNVVGQYFERPYMEE